MSDEISKKSSITVKFYYFCWAVSIFGIAIQVYLIINSLNYDYFIRMNCHEGNDEKCLVEMDIPKYCRRDKNCFMETKVENNKQENYIYFKKDTQNE